MTGRQLQDGADWLYRQFYRLDRIILRTVRAALTVGLVPACLIWRVNMTYRYDNRREGIVGKNPARESRAPPRGSSARVGPAAGRAIFTPSIPWARTFERVNKCPGIRPPDFSGLAHHTRFIVGSAAAGGRPRSAGGRAARGQRAEPRSRGTDAYGAAPFPLCRSSSRIRRASSESPGTRSRAARNAAAASFSAPVGRQGKAKLHAGFDQLGIELQGGALHLDRLTRSALHPQSDAQVDVALRIGGICAATPRSARRPRPIGRARGAGGCPD